MKIQNTNNQLKNFKLKFSAIILSFDIASFLLIGLLMPLIQNFPPFANNLNFLKEIYKDANKLSYIVIFIIIFFLFFIHLFSLRFLMKQIYEYLDKYFNKEKVLYKQIKIVRKDCISIPYKLLFIQLVLTILIGVFFSFTIKVSVLAVLRFILLIISLSSIISVILLIVTQKLLYNIIISTYDISNRYEANTGYRIINSQSLLFQMIPFIAFVLIIFSLIGYSKIMQQKGFAIGNYYKAYMESKNISTEQVNVDSLKDILSSIPLQNDDDYYFIITPNDENIYLSNSNGNISHFVLHYRDYFYDKTNGFLYEEFGTNEQLYMMNLKDSNNQTWYIGFKYPVTNLNLLLFYFAIGLIVLIFYSILLYIWSQNISNNLNKITDGLKNILEKGTMTKSKILPIISNDEFGDLSYYFNKVYDLNIKNIEKMNKNQEILMERERMASLGQLIGGIAHNLKTPIMSISGATEGLNDLIKEYDSSIGDIEVNNDDHHEIASEMAEWTKKIKNYTEYMSDVITAVKGQAVAFSNEDNITFTMEELVKRINILMKHELKNALINLNIILNSNDNLSISGDVNSLVQVINNMISNSIQAYDGKTNQTIDLIIEKRENNIVISVKDYATGIPKKVKDKLFKKMITTKGKNGTGLGLYMSYSTIKANFNGTIEVESVEGEGCTFSVILPTDFI